MAHPIVLTTHCLDCGIERRFNKYDVTRGRHLKLRCRLCAIAHKKLNMEKDTTEVVLKRKEFQRQYYQDNKQRLDAYASAWRAKRRIELITALGGACVHCGEPDADVLDFDHINDDGAAHRRETKRRNVVDLLSVCPEDVVKYQLLCKNCNWRKELARRRQRALKE